MSVKLKKIATNLSELVNKHTTHQDVYNELKNIFIRNNDYFSMFKPYDLLKLTFYVKSYLDYDDFEKGELIFQNCFIAGLFYVSGTYYEKDCDSCRGNGEYDCPECSGNGDEPCNRCDGYGELENGDSCESCDGNGDIACEECGARGSLKCDDCNGDGWIETTSEFFTIENVISWSDAFRLKCMDAEGQVDLYINPTQYDNLKVQDKLIVLSVDHDNHKDFNDRLSVDNIYCIGITDEFDKHLMLDPEFNIYDFTPADVNIVY